jgi:hypothetical protein
MSRQRLLHAEQYERIGTLPGFGVDVGLAVIGERKALITWGQGVLAREVGTKYDADEYVILGRDGQWAERIICSQTGFGAAGEQDYRVNFVLRSRPATATPPRAGWIACDYSQGDHIDEVRHGPICESAQDAQKDVELDGYEGVRYVGTDGYLYMQP